MEGAEEEEAQARGEEKVERREEGAAKRDRSERGPRAIEVERVAAMAGGSEGRGARE